MLQYRLDHSQSKKILGYIRTVDLSSTNLFVHLPRRPAPPGARTALVHICSDPRGPGHCPGTSQAQVTSRSRWPRSTRGLATTGRGLFDSISEVLSIDSPPTTDSLSSSDTASHPCASNCKKADKFRLHYADANLFQSS